MGGRADASTAETGCRRSAVTKAPNWHAWVVADVFLSNMTSGLFLVAALGELTVPQSLAGVSRWAYPLACILLFADLSCLILDLGDPWRFHHMLRIVKISSPMSLGTWCLALYAVPVTFLAVTAVWPINPWEWIHGFAVATGLAPAVGVVLYKGVLLSTSAQPGWKAARWLGGYLTQSALVLGCAQLLAMAIIVGKEEAIEPLRWSLAVVVGMQPIWMWFLWADVAKDVRRVTPGTRLAGLATVVIGGAILAPLVLLATGDSLAMLGGVLLILFGALAVRIQIVQLPHRMERADRWPSA